MSTLEELVIESRERGARARAAALHQVSGINPETYAEQRRQAAALGVPTAAVEALPDEMARQAKSKALDAATANAPVLRQQYTEADFAKLSQDEPGVLARIEQAARRGWRTADTQSDTTDINMRELEGKTLTAEQVAQRAEAEKKLQTLQQEQAGEKAPEFVGRTVGYSVRQGLDSIYTAVKGAGYGGAAGAALGAPLGGVGAAPGAAAGMIAGAAVSTGMYAYRMEAASTWRDLSQMKDLDGNALDPATARVAAQAVGVANAIIEVGSDAAIALLVPGAGKLIEGAVGKQAMKSALLQHVKVALADPVKRSAVAQVLKTAVGIGAIEGAEEFFQTLVGAGGREAAQAKSGQAFTPNSVVDDLDEASRAALEAFVGTSLTFGALTGGANYVSGRAQARLQKAQEAQVEGERIQTLWKAANDSKLLTRAPETLASFAQSAADHHPDGLKAAYIDANTLAEVLDQTGMTIEQVAPTAAEGYAAALASNGTVELPIGELLVSTAGQPIEAALLPNLRTSEDGYSAREATAAQTEAQKLIETESEQVLQAAEDEAAARRSTATIKQVMQTQIDATGRFTPEQGEVKASLVAAFATVMGAKEGITAEEFFAKHPLTVSATGRATDALEQPGGISVEGYRYGKTDRTVIAPVSYGTGLRGSGYEAIMAHPDQRIRKRVYFYADKGTGINPEAGVGGRGHKAQLRNVYDSNRDPLRLKRGGSQYDFESRVIDAGYSGYLDRMEGTQSAQVIMLGPQHIVAEPLGPLGKTKGALVSAPEPRPVKGRDLTADAVRENKSLPAGQLAPARWGALLKSLDPTSYDAMAAAGVFEGGGPLYKSELVAAFEDATEAPDYAGDLNQLDRSSIPGLAKIEKHLTPAERNKLNRGSAARLVAQFAKLPDTKEFAAVAWAGRAKKGWYKESAHAIAQIFGHDAPRFASLLAALSPQQSVQTNLANTLRAWKNWTAAGRPQARAEIVKILGQSVEGTKGEGSVLDAWINNSVHALTTDDPGVSTLSGPKVDSFMRNLLGDVDQVTNDAWMANFALVDQKIFAGSRTKTDAGKSAGYLAMNAKVRAAAKILTEKTGETWAPAEVQETIWSWAKTLYEMQVEGATATDILYNEEMTDEMIRSTPDFRGLFHDEKYASILRDAGYGDQLGGLDHGVAGQEVDRTGGQAGPFDSDTQSRLENSAARRLEELKRRSETPIGEDFSQFGAVSATLDDFSAENLPDLLHKDNWAVLTAEDPNATKATPEANAAAQAALRADLDAMGATYIDAVGKYGDVQNALIVTGIAEDQALALGQKYGQESILTRSGLVYSDGRPNTPATGMEVYGTAPSDFYTEVPSTGGYFSVVLDWGSDNVAADTVAEDAMWQRAEKGPAVLAQAELVELRKQEKVLQKLLECIG